MKLLSFLFSFVLFTNHIYAQEQKQVEYVSFLHNKFLEEHTEDDKHPQYGNAEYEPILHKLKTKNTIVISEKRKANTDPKAYAKLIISKIDSLHKIGVPYAHISIVGTSMGGYIAQYISNYAKNDQLKFIIIGASFAHDSLNKDKDFRLYGKILAINEQTDTNFELLAQQDRYKKSTLKNFKEITLHTGRNHGFLFKALDEWIKPTNQWINTNFQ